MKNQDSLINIEMLIDYCNGSLDAEEQKIIAQTAENNELVQTIIEELKNQAPIPKEVLAEDIDQSMTTFLDSDTFTSSFKTISNDASEKIEEKVKKNGFKKSIFWLLGIFGVGLLCLLAYQTDSNNQEEGIKSGMGDFF
ncbi:MAG: hypothetical protein AAFO07_34120 [Bacteroidota bacterium]